MGNKYEVDKDNNVHNTTDPALEELGDVEEDGEESDGHNVGGQAPAVRASVAGHATVLHRLVHRDISDTGCI